MRLIYTGLLYLILPLALLRLYGRGRRDAGHRRRWRERLGFVPPLPPGGLWLHAVSVGETRAALPLIRALLDRYPDLPLLVTTTTLTGSRQVREALGERVHHVYAPYDLPGATRRFLRRVRPRLAVIMETELWPNLLRQCATAGIPVLLANARLSERSARGYGRIRGLTAAMLRDVTLIAAQADADAARFRALGAPRVEVTGNLKYDLAPPTDLPERGRQLRRDLLGTSGRSGSPPVPMPAKMKRSWTRSSGFASAGRHCCYCWSRATRNASTAWRHCAGSGDFPSPGVASGTSTRRTAPCFSATAWENCYCSTPPPIWPSSAAAWSPPVATTCWNRRCWGCRCCSVRTCSTSAKRASGCWRLQRLGG